MHPLLVVACLLLSSSALAETPMEIAKAFQADLNDYIFTRVPYRIEEKMYYLFFSTNCYGPNFDKHTFAENLNKNRRLGTVTSAWIDQNYIYYKVNYGQKWNMVYLVNYKLGRGENRELVFAKQVDCQFVDRPRF